jgi:hypothetical protein
MPEKILFQQDRLTVSNLKITVGNATVFYPSVSATSIYEGRPYVVIGVAGLTAMLPLGLIWFFGALMVGLPMNAIAILFIPMIGMAIFGFTYKLKCLFLSVDGSSVAVLKSKDRFELEAAQGAIESAKRAYEFNDKKG